MNSTELYIKAGGAISLWRVKSNHPCLLSIRNGNVICGPSASMQPYGNNPLYVSKFEIDRGMSAVRWNAIGSALHNLYCKELACQARQKH